LTTADGSPVNTAVQATFRIYTDTNPAIAPTSIWSSAMRTITPTNGLFTVNLGDGSDPTLFNFVVVYAAMPIASPSKKPSRRVNAAYTCILSYMANRPARALGLCWGNKPCAPPARSA
jgi:hypothetical protein